MISFEIFTINPLFTAAIIYIWYCIINSFIILFKEKPVIMIKRIINSIPIIIMSIVFFIIVNNISGKLTDFFNYTLIILIPIIYSLPFQDLIFKTMDRGFKNFVLQKKEGDHE